MNRHQSFAAIHQPWDDCCCGRKFGDVHCPHCGSQNHRAVPSKKNEALLPNGDLLMNNMWYSCRKCGNYFDDAARLVCSAAAPKTPVSQLKAQNRQQVAYKSEAELPQHQKDILAQLRKMRGME